MGLAGESLRKTGAWAETREAKQFRSSDRQVSNFTYAYFRPHRVRPVITDGVAWSVGLPVTIVSPAKTAEPIEMPFETWTQVGPKNHVLDGGPGPPREGTISRGKMAAHC